MRVGIIGGGFGLKVQAPIIEAHPDMDLIAVCTMNRHQLPEELANRHDAPVHYKKWTEMLDAEAIDLLFVSSIPLYHYEITKYAIEKGIDVVCEKPFTMNSKQSLELLRLSEKMNVKVLVDFEWRYLPVRQKIKDWILNRRIGELLHVEYHVSSAQYERLGLNKRGWMGEKEKFGGMLGALGSHMIDCLRWLTADEVASVNGLVHTHVPEGAGEVRDADDGFLIHGKLRGNTTFSLQLLSGIHHGFGSSLKLFGTLGTITLSDDQNLYFGKANEPLEEISVQADDCTPVHLPDAAKSYCPAFHPFLNHAYNYFALGKKDRDLPTIADGHENQKMIDRILKE